jgi:hypothetical protein
MSKTLIPVHCFISHLPREIEFSLTLHFTDLREYKQQEIELKTKEKQVKDLLYKILPQPMDKRLISKPNEDSTHMISNLKLQLFSSFLLIISWLV